MTASRLDVLLLKGIAAVAEVHRQEDVGIDAVVTLLRLDDVACETTAAPAGIRKSRVIAQPLESRKT